MELKRSSRNVERRRKKESERDSEGMFLFRDVERKSDGEMMDVCD